MITGNSLMKIKKQMQLEKQVSYTDQDSKRGTSNLLDERIYPTVVFKIDVSFVLLKQELPNKSTFENLESFRFKILLQMFGMLFMRIGL